MSSDVRKGDPASSTSTDSQQPDDESKDEYLVVPSLSVTHPSSSSLQLPNISNLSIESTASDAKRPPMQPVLPARSVSDSGPPRPSSSRFPTGHSSGSDSPLATIQAARGVGARPPPASSTSSSATSGVSKLPAGMQAKMMAFHASRSSRSSSPSVGDSSSPTQETTSPPAHRPAIGGPRSSAPAISGAVTGGALFGQRPVPSPRQSGLNRRAGMGMKLSGMATPDQKASISGVFGSDFNKWSEIVDTQNSRLQFSGKAILHSEGVDFSGGQSFSLRLTDLMPLEELGKGNYGTVVHVVHKVTNAHMAMKQIKLELDNSKFMAIITELQMDGGSLDKLVPPGIGIRDEKILSWVTSCTVRGLKYLKDNLNIIHRDVKPTNILVNSKGDVKLCDFGVSGNLVASLAKTNIGCQSYMAPERIRGDNTAGSIITYSVQSDIWSLGLSILEIAKGVYPYPPETYNSVFAQLSAIVDGEPPELPEEFSETAQGFVRQCLNKIPRKRPTFNALLEHPWLLPLSPARPDFAQVEASNREMLGQWVRESIAKRKEKEGTAAADETPAKPPLHAIKKEAEETV